MKFLAKLSVENSLIVNVFSIFIAIAGIVSLFQMHREAFPSIDMDIVVVQTLYPNSTPIEVEKLITIPIEKELRAIDDIKEIRSVSAEGLSRISIELEEDLDNKIQVLNDIQRAVDQAEDLPKDLPDKPFVSEMKTKNTPVIDVALSGKMPEMKLRQQAKALENRIEQIPDYARMGKNGYREHEIWVEVKPETLAEHHLSLTEIMSALASQNKTLPGGKFYDDKTEYVLRTTGEFENAADVGRTVVRASTMGNWITVADVAKVTDALQDESIINKTLGTRSINLTIIKKEKGDSIDLVNQIKIAVEEFKKTAPPELNITLVNDLSFFIKRRLNVLVNNGVIGLILVAISLFVFLSPGTAIGACIGIPTALFSAFFLMNIFDISINLLSLFGMIMVLGMLVDEDIIVSENIYRHLEKGLSPKEAAIKGSSEVNRAVFATVLTTIVAFIPLYYMEGMTGKFTRHIPTVVILTLLASLVEAILVLPSHVADITEQMQKRFAGRMNKHHGHRLFDKIQSTYERTIRHCIRFRYRYTALLLSGFAGTMVFAFLKMQFILFPSKGIEIFFIQAEVPQGHSIYETEAKLAEIEAIVARLPKTELDVYATQVGFIQREPNDQKQTRAINTGQIAVYLTPENDRERTSEDIMDALRPQVEKLNGFESIHFEKFRHGPPVGEPVEIKIIGDDFKVLQHLAAEYKKALKTIPGVVDIDDDHEANIDEKRVVVDPTLAAQAGLTVESVAFAVRQAFEGIPATKIKTPEEEIKIITKYPESYRHDTQSLKSLRIPNAQGRLIPLHTVAKVQNTKGLLSINHIDGLRTITVTASIKEDITSAMQVNQILLKKHAHIADSEPGYVVQFKGEFEKTQESLRNLKMAFGVACGLILIILIASFRSLIQPLVILVTIPFSLIGVIIAFHLHGEVLSFMAVLGMIALTGIVVDGGIIMIDFINHNLAEGMDPIEAVVNGAKTRLRSVFLTTLTTTLGVMPSTYGFGGSDPFIVPMALTMNYGILFSVVLTLIYIPLFQIIVWDIKKFMKRTPLRTPNYQSI